MWSYLLLKGSILTYTLFACSIFLFNWTTQFDYWIERLNMSAQMDHSIYERRFPPPGPPPAPTRAATPPPGVGPLRVPPRVAGWRRPRHHPTRGPPVSGGHGRRARVGAGGGLGWVGGGGNETNEWMNEWMHEWMHEWVNAWMNEWMSEWMKLMNEWMDETNEWMNEWMNEWVSQWVSEWVSQWVSQWVSESVSQWVSESVSQWVSEWVDNIYIYICGGKLLTELSPDDIYIYICHSLLSLSCSASPK